MVIARKDIKKQWKFLKTYSKKSSLLFQFDLMSVNFSENWPNNPVDDDDDVDKIFSLFVHFESIFTDGKAVMNVFTRVSGRL